MSTKREIPIPPITLEQAEFARRQLGMAGQVASEEQPWVEELRKSAPVTAPVIFNESLKLLRELYKAVQILSMVGSALGWKCKVCDRPHPSYRECDCPCHRVKTYLEEVDG